MLGGQWHRPPLKRKEVLHVAHTSLLIGHESHPASVHRLTQLPSASSTPLLHVHVEPDKVRVAVSHEVQLNDDELQVLHEVSQAVQVFEAVKYLPSEHERQVAELEHAKHGETQARHELVGERY